MAPDDESQATGPGAMAIAPGVDRPPLPRAAIERARRTRRHPRRTQFDYLHLHRLVDDLGAALAAVPPPVNDVLDVFCGTRPYEDMLPAGSRITGFDIDDRFGSADVTGHEFLPFDDDSFDLAICTSGFQYVPDPARGVEEIGRVLRPSGTAVVTVPLLWEYDREVFEHRFTGPSLAALFDGWEEVELVENGGRGVAWALLTGHLLYLRERHLPQPLRRLAHPLFALAYAAVNGVGAMLERGAARREGSQALPPNFLVRARGPAG